MDGDVTILVKEIANAITIPIEAVNDDNGQSFVWLQSGDKLEKQNIKTGIETDTKIEVLEGLNQNAKVVIKKT
jgi:HlyD family secretion protein